MNLSLPWLAFIIQIPTFAVLGWLFARGRPTRMAWPLFAGALLLALVATSWGFQSADRRYGLLWPQVFAAVLGYGVFLAALASAWILLGRSKRTAVLSDRATPVSPQRD